MIVPMPDLVEAKQTANADAEDAQKAQKLIELRNIETQQGLQNSVVWLAEVKNRHKEVDEKKKSFTKPLKQVIKEIDKFFNPALKSLKEAERLMKEKIDTYLREEEQKRNAALASVQKTKNPEKRDALLKKAESSTVEKVSGMAVRESWTGEVTNEADLLAWIFKNKRFKFISINKKVLLEVTKAAGKDPKIPGWTVTPTKSIAITPSRVK